MELRETGPAVNTAETDNAPSIINGYSSEALKSIAERIRSRCVRDPEILPGHTIGCLVWQGAKAGCGYGEIRFEGGVLYVHRLMYLAHNGPIPSGHLVRHTCDVPLCVEPEHLVSGTNQQNMDDMAARGRRALKFSDREVVEILGLYHFMREDWTLEDLAKEFGVSRSHVRNICRGDARANAVGNELDREQAAKAASQEGLIV